MEFFSIRTNDQYTIGQILNNKKRITFNTLSWHKNEISINDIVFIVISGDNSKKEHDYENGLRAVGKISQLPKDEGDGKHFSIQVEIFEFLDNSITKDDFYIYPSLKDAPNIGPDTKSAPNQAFRKIDPETGKSIIRAVFDMSGNKLDISKYEKIVDNNFKIVKLIKDEDIKIIKNINSQIRKNNSASKDSFNLNAFFQSTKDSGLIFSEQLLQRFIASLCTKPFVICSGLSGSGKTKLAQAFAQWISADKAQYVIVPVGADWTNREPLLGYPNALDEMKYISPENGVLELMIRAKQNMENTEEATKPYFLILDEMNLSHVERYFADFLSTMESGDSIPLHKIVSVSEEEIHVPQSIKLPKNLFIIGTVNIDETTYMFSPKVLDRANTIEFRLTETDLEEYIKSDTKLNMDLLTAQGVNMSDSFMAMALQETDKNLKPSEVDLKLFFSELKKSGAEFGFRSAGEIGRLMKMLELLGEKGDNLLDIAIMQKLLPKLHGSRNKLTKILPVLGGFCLKNKEKIKETYLDKFDGINFAADENIRYRISFEKICRMYKNAVENGFASYAEA